MPKYPVTSIHEQFPVKGLGRKSVDAALGSARIVLGASGLVATVFGQRETSATRIATGVYDLRFPTSKAVSIFPTIRLPSGGYAYASGYEYNVKTASVSGPSGMAQIFITEVGPTILTGRVNPRTGTEIDLLFFHSPSNAY
jgi:hypothetical protein